MNSALPQKGKLSEDDKWSKNAKIVVWNKKLN